MATQQYAASKINGEVDDSRHEDDYFQIDRNTDIQSKNKQDAAKTYHRELISMGMAIYEKMNE